MCSDIVEKRWTAVWQRWIAFGNVWTTLCNVREGIPSLDHVAQRCTTYGNVVPSLENVGQPLCNVVTTLQKSWPTSSPMRAAALRHLRLVTAEYSRRPLGGGPTPAVPDHAMAWWREADAGWLLACRCRPGAGSTGCAGLNASRGVTTGCQHRPASGCADVDRDWDDRAVYGGEHALPADVTIGIADPGLSEWRKVTCNVFSGFPTNFGSLSHQLSLRCRKPSLTCIAQLAGIGGSSFLSRKMCLSISFHLCLHFTQVSQIKALRSKLRFHVLIKILASFEFRALIQYKDVILLSGVPDYFDRNKISSGGDLSHYSSASLY